MFYYKQEMNYEAPKWMEGVYALKVHGRKITIERLNHDDDVPTKSHATCHKDDQFDIGEGAKVALDRLKEKKEEKFEVGDNVKIVFGGYACSTIKNVDPEFASRYRYGVCPNDGTFGEIVGWYDKKNGIALVHVTEEKYLGNPKYSDLPCFDSIYAIYVAGLKKV